MGLTHRRFAGKAGVSIPVAEGLSAAIKKQPALIGGINVMDGKVRNEAVAHAHGLPYAPVE